MPPLASLDCLPLQVSCHGDIVTPGRASESLPLALLPGSFNPVHAGHWQLALAAERLLGVAVAFELSVVNVDKPELTVHEVQRRVAQFLGRAEVWLTRAPLFTDKAEVFPGAMFVVGADTALRLVQPRYYRDDKTQMLQALANLQERGCRFLVGGRVDGDRRFVTLDDLPVPVRHRSLFVPIPEIAFRCDTSSSSLRLQ